jgi:acetyl-CoA carboxylase carboxyltransferase component
VREVIRLVMDTDSFFEVQSGWARNMVVGFARIGGIPVGIIANQANVKAGCLDIDASDKASRFIRFCDAYTIPIVTLEDVPGYLPGVEQEHGGIIRHGAKLIYAYSEATTPMVTVVLRKAYGGSYIGMCCRELGADWVLAWPQAQVAVMGAQGAANIVFRKDIEAAKDPVAMRSQKIDEYEEAFANPYKAAERGYVDRVILPEETRSAIYEALVLAESKKDQRPRRKHGVMPN